MIRYTTPSYALTVDADLSGADEVHVTMKQCGVCIDIDDADAALDGESTVLTFGLSQEQSARFREGLADIQVNWMQDGKRNATTIKQVPVGRNLLERVV